MKQGQRRHRIEQAFSPRLVWLLAWSLVLAFTGCSQQSPSVSMQNNAGAGGPDDQATPQWFSAWGTASYTFFPNGPLTQDSFSPTTAAFNGDQAVEQSFRMMIHPTVRGERLRLRFSNRFGDRPLQIRNANVALRAADSGAAIDATSLAAVAFDGASEISIPAGEWVVSDGVEFAYQHGDYLAVSFHVPGPSGPMSWHAESFATQYISAPNSGDVTTDASGANFSSADRGWFFLSGMDVQIDEPGLNASNAEPFTIVAFGDSITDGAFGTLEINHRWPDFLAQRLQDIDIAAGIVNVGINSNSVIPTDRNPVTTGIPGVDRFATDVLSRSGVRSVFILLGTNDITAGKSAEQIFNGLLQLRDLTHAADVCIVVSTILPRNDPPEPFGWDPIAHPPVREALNDMILSSNAFDGVTDALATAMENPLAENQPSNALFVEGLHPNSAGMQTLANAVPIELLLPSPLGTCSR